VGSPSRRAGRTVHQRGHQALCETTGAGVTT
jgi:hypothetical protein